MRTRQVNKGGNDVEQEVVIIVKDDGTVIEDFATQTTLALVAKDATLALVATEATLGTVHGHVDSIDGKVTKCDTDNVGLKAGVASIGKLGANSGVDIGDVTVDNGVGNAVPVQPGTGAVFQAQSNSQNIATETTLGTVHGHVDSIDTKITACNTGAVTVADVVKTCAPTYVQATLANTTKIYDPAAGKKPRIKLIDCWNSGAANITVDFRMTAAGAAKFKKTLAANTGFIVNLQHCNWEGAADEDLFINLSGAGTVDVTVMAEDIT